MNKLFDNLMKICNTEIEDNAFYFKDFESIGGGLYRIFAYRLASYTGYLQTDALECRGTMFELNKETLEPIRLAAKTPSKFFNAYENPFSMYEEMPSSEIMYSMDKRDGSLISTFTDTDGVLRTKSHGSLHSEHAYNTTKMIHDDLEFKQHLEKADLDGYTVNLEYTSPEYRIVLPYQDDQLVVLNLRNRETGKVLLGNELKDMYPELYERSVFHDVGDIHPTTPIRATLRETVEAIRGMKDIEGYVIVLKDGRQCKVKTDWYCSLHYTRDSIVIDSRLYKAVLEGASDDLRQMFSNDPYSINKIEKMERHVFSCYNRLVSTVENFVNDNKDLTAKEFAVKVTSTLPKTLGEQGLAFSLRNRGTADYKEIMLKYMSEILKGF